MPILGFLLFICAVSFAYAGWRGAPWVPTWKRDIERLRVLLNLKSGEQFYELGCGDGRVTLALAQATGTRGTGIELSIAQWAIARVRAFLSPSLNVQFLFGDVFSKDLSRADAVYLFLMPETYAKIQSKLEKELKPGTRVVTYVWPMKGWTPAVVDRHPEAPALFLYIRP